MDLFFFSFFSDIKYSECFIGLIFIEDLAGFFSFVLILKEGTNFFHVKSRRVSFATSKL